MNKNIPHTTPRKHTMLSWPASGYICLGVTLRGLWKGECPLPTKCITVSAQESIPKAYPKVMMPRFPERRGFMKFIKLPQTCTTHTKHMFARVMHIITLILTLRTHMGFCVCKLTCPSYTSGSRVGNSSCIAQGVESWLPPVLQLLHNLCVTVVTCL